MDEFRTMLGGVTEVTALKILEQGRIKFFFIRRRHLIPKVYAKTREACEKKRMVLIAKMDREILAQKARMMQGDE